MLNGQQSDVADYEKLYHPDRVLKDPFFRVLDDKEVQSAGSDINLACAYNPEHVVHVVQKPMPRARAGECVVHVKATGICGSDVHFWKHGRIGPMIVTDECGAGHESAGEIIEVGEGVTQWKVGDRVAIECGVPCGQPDCKYCLTGRYNACPRVVFFSTPPYHGTLTRYHAHPAAWLHKLPDNVSFEEGSVCEPLAVALAGLQRSGAGLADPLLICGAGPIGLVTLLAAQASGCCPIVITDLVQSRLDFAKNLVPTVKPILIQREWTAEETAAKIKAAAQYPLDHVLECTGFESSIHAAIYSLDFGGKCFIIGVGAAMQKIPFGYCAANEIDIQFQYRYANQYPRALRLVANGQVNLKPLVTHRFPLEKAVDAFHVAADPTKGAIKVQIQDL